MDIRLQSAMNIRLRIHFISRTYYVLQTLNLKYDHPKDTIKKKLGNGK